MSYFTLQEGGETLALPRVDTAQTVDRHKTAAPGSVQWQEAGGSGGNLISLRFPAWWQKEVPPWNIASLCDPHLLCHWIIILLLFRFSLYSQFTQTSWILMFLWELYVAKYCSRKYLCCLEMKTWRIACFLPSDFMLGTQWCTSIIFQPSFFVF